MALTSHQKVRTILDGEYGSVFKGRSMDFDDLREYVPGDDVKDIDWKATARSGQVLLKRYIAIRKHNILLVVDTGRSMATTASSGVSKKDLSVFVSGVMASIVIKHGDLLALVSGNAAGAQRLPLQGSRTHAERILQRIDRSTRLDSAASSLDTLLEYVTRVERRRMMIVIVTDVDTLSDQTMLLLRRLRAQHEVMWVSIREATPFSTVLESDRTYDVDSPLIIPDVLRANPAVRAAVEQEQQQRWQQLQQLCNTLAISAIQVGADSEVIEKIIELLERQRYVGRR